MSNLSSLKLYFEQPEVKAPATPYLPEKERFDNQLTDSDFRVAILGVNEDTNSLLNRGCAAAPDAIRRQLYALRHSFKIRIADLGNLRKGKGLNDTFFALRDIVGELTENGIVPIVLGGSQDLTVPMFNGLKEQNLPLNLTVLDSRLDLGDGSGDFNAHSFLEMLANEPLLDQLEPLAYQNYFVSETQLTWLKNKQGSAGVRLGIARKRLPDLEPTLRDTDLLSVDMSVLRQADSPAHALATPNGLAAEEAAQLMLYAGYSDRLKALGLFELNPTFDRNEQSAATAAQMIWHFIEGVNSRVGDYPVRPLSGYAKYIIQQRGEAERDIVFYNNPANARWWLEVPASDGQNRVLSCTFDDYNLAKMGRIPDLWLRYYLK